MMTEPIELTYVLHLLPPGRIAFRRWRWELWHGSQLLAAGWRLTVQHAQRALGAHAWRYAHRLNGVHLLHPGTDRTPESVWRGETAAVDCGPLKVLLRPRVGPETSAHLLLAPG